MDLILFLLRAGRWERKASSQHTGEWSTRPYSRLSFSEVATLPILMGPLT